jgi:hypothetical protein
VRLAAVSPGASLGVQADLDRDALSVVSPAGARVYPTGQFMLVVGDAQVAFTVSAPAR